MPARSQPLLFGALFLALALAAAWIAWLARTEARPSALALADEPEQDDSAARAVEEPIERTSAVELAPAPARGAQRTARAREVPRTIAHGVCGTVRDERGDPVAAARVEVLLELGPRVRRLATATTNERGWYEAELDLADEVDELARDAREADFELHLRLARALAENAPAEELDRWRRDIERASGGRIAGLTLAVEAGLPGRGWRRATRELKEPLPSMTVLNLRLSSGAVVGGHVFHRGAPVAGATVQLFDADWNFVRNTKSDGEGRYRLGVPEPGRFQIHARAEGRGASGNEGFSLGEALPFPEIDIDVDGFAALTGRVMLPDGQPIRALRVQSLQHGLWQGEAFNGRNADVAMIAQAESSGGLCASEASTDEHGVFYMAGMQQGDFVLRIPALRDEALQPQGVYTTGAETHVLMIDVHLLVIEVRAEGYRWRDRRERRAEQIEILCSADPPLVASAYAAGHFAYSAGADLGATFVVEPGARYVVRARTRYATAEASIVVAETPRVQRLELELEDWDPEVAAELDVWSEEAPGQLELAISDDAGEVVRGLRAHLVRDEDGRELALDLPRGREGEPLAAPPGIYELRIEPTGAEALRLMPHTEQGVRVRSGETTRVEARLASGGSFVLRIPRGSVPELAERIDGTDGTAKSLAALRAVIGIEALLYRRREEQEPGSWMPVDFDVEGADPPRVRRLLPGEEGRSAAVEVGAYLLELRSEFTTAEWIELEIVSGERKVVVPELRRAQKP